MMSIRKISVLIVWLVAGFQVNLHADEGMWLLSLIEQVNMDEMTELGLELTAEQIYSVETSSLKDAVGALDRGSCTAELVSPEGLLLTNHHCGYDEIQHHSSVEHDYLKDGFWAMTRDEELPNEGKSITFLVRMEEVTDQIAPKLNEKMGMDEREAFIRSLSGTITSEATEGSHYEAEVRSMFDGNRFFLFVTETFLDVRLVGAPPESIGKFGGNTDNWMWPRHTGDFSIFRVYTGPDGLPASYSPDNIPLKSKHYLPVSLKGYELEDFTMVMGFPGRTSRYLTSWEIKELLDIRHPDRIHIRGAKQEIMMEDMLANQKVRIQYSSKYSRSANYWKYSIGQSEGIKSQNLLSEQREQEAAFTAWVNQSDERKALYGNVLSNIRQVVEKRAELLNASLYLEETTLRAQFTEGGMESVNFARSLRELERAMADPDADGKTIQGVARDLANSSAAFYKDFNPSTEKKVMTAMLHILIDELDDQYLPSNILGIKNKYKGDVSRYVERYFKKSFVVDQKKYLAFMENPSLKVLRKDPAYIASVDIQIYFEIRGKMAEFDDQFDRARRLYMKGLVEMYPDKDFYSDANSTMRMSYGKVGDYTPRDGVLYKHYTTLYGVMEKEDPSNFEFEVTDKLKELYEEKEYGQYGEDGKLNVCFTSNNDITGGNSGSPIINGRGELMGLAFDGNWEAMSGDVVFEEELQKCINVDIRYVLFLIDKYAGAGHLIKEMTLVN